VKLWRDLLDQNELRMVIDGMQYYSEAVNILNDGKAIHFSYLDFASNLTPNMDQNKKAQLNSTIMASLDFQGKIAENVFDGMFANKEDIQLLASKLIDSKTNIYQEKYF